MRLQWKKILTGDWLLRGACSCDVLPAAAAERKDGGGGQRLLHYVQTAGEQINLNVPRIGSFDLFVSAAGVVVTLIASLLRHSSIG